MKRISIDFDEDLMNKLLVKQGEHLIKTKKKISLSKIVTSIIEDSLKNEKASQK
jgi:metal-responsive CopG/Arc/MetJ family transcriptional regulator